MTTENQAPEGGELIDLDAIAEEACLMTGNCLVVTLADAKAAVESAFEQTRCMVEMAVAQAREHVMAEVASQPAPAEGDALPSGWRLAIDGLRDQDDQEAPVSSERKAGWHAALDAVVETIHDYEPQPKGLPVSWQARMFVGGRWADWKECQAPEDAAEREVMLAGRVAYQLRPLFAEPVPSSAPAQRAEWVGISLGERLDNLMHAAKWDADEVPAMKANLIRDIERCALSPAVGAATDDFAAHTVLSGVARHKVKDLIASGYRICGYTMERPGHRSAVVFDAAVRWLTEDQRHTLMFVEGARVVGQPATDEQVRDAFGRWSCRMADALWLVQTPLERGERTYRDGFRDGERAHGITAFGAQPPVQPMGGK